jgi:mono/diheme cytochrome c family protein
MRLQSICGVLGVLGVLAVLRAPVTAQDPMPTAVTFDEVRAVLRSRCTSCHSAGGPAPMPLTTYDEVRPWARAIKDQILARRMPKWAAAHGYGAFANDPSLTPAEMAVVAAWVDAGAGSPGSTGSAGSTGSGSAGPPGSPGSIGRGAVRVTIPAAAVDTTVRTGATWIGGWDFEPGDALITSARFSTASGVPIATWVAGDPPIRLPADTAMRVPSAVHVELTRRKPADHETVAAAKPSVLRWLPPTTAPTRRVQAVRWPCGSPWTGSAGEILAVRPVLDSGTSVRLWLERPGAPRMIIGWFRDYDALYARAYWLARPTALPLESVVAADTACSVDLLVSVRR